MLATVLVKAVLALVGHSRHLQQLSYVLLESMTPKVKQSAAHRG